MGKQKIENRKQWTENLAILCSLFSFRSQRGFTLLLAALVASITLAIGTAIFTLAQKEVTLSSIGRDSQYAFYAADTGAECALYWDSRFQSFPSTTPVAAVDITCDSQRKMTADNSLTVSIQGNVFTSSFQFEPNGFCADVTVVKTVNPVSGVVSTVVHADGFSVGSGSQGNCDAAIAASPRALQRSVELHY